MRTAHLLSAALLGITFLGNANAALVSRDWDRPGDGLLTLDTESGLEWLDLTASTYTNSAVIRRETQVGGRYEGFKWGSVADVSTLFTHAGWSGQWGNRSGSDGEAMGQLIDLLGKH